MSVRPELLLLFVCMGLVTYIPRALPLVLFTRWKAPLWLEQWLEMIPAAILSALLLPALLLEAGPVAQLDFTNIRLLVALPTVALAFVFRSLAGTVLAGMALYWLADNFLPL